MFANRRYCKFASFNSIKLLLINVKKVKKPTDNVTIKTIAINIFSFSGRLSCRQSVKPPIVHLGSNLKGHERSYLFIIHYVFIRLALFGSAVWLRLIHSHNLGIIIIRPKFIDIVNPSTFPHFVGKKMKSTVQALLSWYSTKYLRCCA